MTSNLTRTINTTMIAFMLDVLIGGVMIKDPVSRVGKSGKEYATFFVRAPCDGEDAVLVSAIVFSPEPVAQVLALGKGDAVSFAGSAKLTNWTKADGSVHHGIGVTVSQILSSYHVQKKRRVMAGAEQQEEG